VKTFFINNRKKDILLAIILSLFIISFAVVFTVFFKQLYYFDIDYLDLVQKTGMSKETIQTNYDVLIQYQSLFFKGALELPDFVMSETGRIHFEEVKVIFELIQITCLFTGAVSAIMIYFRWKEKDCRFLRLTVIFTIGLPTILGFLAALDFNKAFIIFHKIAFRNDYWIFDDRTDPIIRILPEAFFMHCFMLIITMILIISMILYVIYRRQRKKILEHS